MLNPVVQMQLVCIITLVQVTSSQATGRHTYWYTDSDYLKQYVEMLDQEDLEAFLRFATVTSVMPEKITVAFSNLTGEERRPIVHTCSSLLHLPATYISMRDWKQRFTAILPHLA